MKSLRNVVYLRLYFETSIGTYRQPQVSGSGSPLCMLLFIVLARGYAAEVGGDAQRFHPKLRPPVNPHELEIDPETGMKVSQPISGRLQ